MEAEEVKQKFAGMVGEPIVNVVEKGSIKRYAYAVEDPNPLYYDEEYAARSRYGTVIAPPGFFGWPAKPGPMLPKLMLDLLNGLKEAGYPNLLDGGIELEFMVPIRAGDVLVSSPKIMDVNERTTKAGTKMVFGTIETTYINQNGDTVAKARQNLICLPGA